MIAFLRKIVFKVVPRSSFLSKIADKLLTREIFLYLVFGVATTVVNLIAFWLCNRAFDAAGWEGTLGSIFVSRGWEKAAELFSKNGSEYLDSTLIAWFISVIFAFFTNKLFVFESKSWAPSTALREFVSFTGARVFSLLVELFSMFLLVTIAGLNDYIAKILVGVIVVIINYIFSKLLIFRKDKETDGKEEQ